MNRPTLVGITHFRRTMKKEIILTSMAVVVLLIGIDVTTVRADSPPVSSLYTHNFNNATFFAPDGVTARASNSGYNEHIVRDICGRDWHITMGQKFGGEAYLGWNNVQSRAESSTTSFHSKYPNAFTPTTGVYYSAIGTEFTFQNALSVEFQYFTAYATGKSIYIIMSLDDGQNWTIIKSGTTLIDGGTLKHTFTEAVAGVRFAFVQNFNSFSNTNGRIKMTNVIVEVA